MLSQIIKPGDRLEMTKVNTSENSSENNSKNAKISTYFSKIYDIIDEDKLKIAMPTEGPRMVVIGINTKYDICIFTDNGLYRCKAIVIERYKENNLYVAVLELYTGLQKYQRRQHYRLSCNLELQYQILTDEEAYLLMNARVPSIYRETLVDKGYIKGITLDISGGGIHFVSGCEVEAEKYILCNFTIKVQGEPKQFSIVSRLLQSKEVPNRRGTYEHRVQFGSITSQDREDLIKFIFEEERRHRKNEKG